MTVEGIKERIALLSQYDLTLEKLMKELDEFSTKSKTLIREKQESIKLYGYAFNLAWSLYNCIDVCSRYETEIKNSLFYGRYDKNRDNAEKFDIKINEILPFVEELIQSFSLEDSDANLNQLADEIDKEQLLSDSKYLAKLKRHLSINGNKILNIVCFYLRYLNQLLANIRNFRANLTDNDYRFLFEREFKDYLSTDEWQDTKDGFIENVIKYKYRGVDPSIGQLNELLFEEVEKISEMSDHFGAIDSYINNYSQLSRQIIKKEFVTDINTPILELFLHLGRKQVIEQWIYQLEGDEFCYMPEEESMEVTYSERYSEYKCKRTMPKILELYEDRDAIDWVCFYHVLVRFNYISCPDFNVFARWLNQVTNRNIISSVNARKINMSYWADKAKEQWTKEGALNVTNTVRQEKKFAEYMKLCFEIRPIIDEAIR